jgi:phage major head subunit gpT-like protein
MIITNATLEALRTNLRRNFQEGFDAMRAESFFNRVSTIVPSSTKSNTYGWLGDFPDLVEWVGDRVVKDMKEDAYQIANKLWESTIGVKKTDIEDDELGIYAPRARYMGEAAGRHPDILVAGLLASGPSSLCYDGQFFFDTDHPVYPNHDGTGVATTVSNYDDGTSGTPGPTWYLLDVRKVLRPIIFQERTRPEFDAVTDPTAGGVVFMKDQYLYGIRARHNVGFGLWQTAYASRAPLNGDTLDAAIATMMGWKADGGRPLGVMPNLLVVPPALRADANKTVKVMLTTGGASNANYEAVEVLVTPWLA